MTPNKSPFFLISILLILVTIACTVFVGGPDYSDLDSIPVSQEAAQALRDGIKKSFEDGLATGVVTITISEPQITSYLALRMQTDPTMQQSDRLPILTDPQVYLRNGQMKIFGKTRQGLFTANIGIVLEFGTDETGQPKIEIVSADFGPFPAPEGFNGAITALIEEAYTGSLGPVATGLRIEVVTISDGLMTVTGRIR